MKAYLKTRVPFVPSNSADIEAVLSIVGSAIAGQSFADLGSGDGRVVLEVAKKTKVQAVGFELSRAMCWYSTTNAKISGVANTEFRRLNFFTVDLSQFNYIYGYLFPRIMLSIEEEVIPKLKPGTKLVFKDFPLPNKVPEKTIAVSKNHTLYIYTIRNFI